MDLRALEKRDIPQIAEYLHQPALRGLTGIEGDTGSPMSLDSIEEAVEGWRTDRHTATRVIEQGGSIAGHVRLGGWWDALTPFLEVVVKPGERGRGLGGEAARVSLQHLFSNTPAHVVHASAPDWNEDGIRFASRLGFERAGAMRRTGIRNGRYVDTVEFELLRTRWEGMDATRR